MKCPFLLGDMDVRISNANSGFNRNITKSPLKLRGLFVKNKEANDIIEQTKEVIQKWKTLASNAGVSKTKMNEIGRKILTI